MLLVALAAGLGLQSIASRRSFAARAPLQAGIQQLELARARHSAPPIAECVAICKLLCEAEGGTRAQAFIHMQSKRTVPQALKELTAAFKSTDPLDFQFNEDHLADVLLEALANSADDAAAHDVAKAVAASARVVLLAPSEREALWDQLEVALTSPSFLEARRAALAAVRRRCQATSNGRSEPFSMEDDHRVVTALITLIEEHLGPPILSPLGFPPNQHVGLGLRCLAAASRLSGSQRAAASLGRVWHAADGQAPLFLTQPVHSASDACNATGTSHPARARTLVVSFSSLGWHGLIRAEWLGTLRAYSARSGEPIDVAHALDTSRSWFAANPMTGEFDDGSWWDEALATLSARYDRVCLLGESMGGSAALRFARHASPDGAVVALVPQVDVGEFACCTRADFGPSRQRRLRRAIANACAESRARVMLHVGRDADDLQQLAYLPSVVDLYAAHGDGDAPEEPLVRDGLTESTAVEGADRALRVVKHDVEGHALAHLLKARGALHDIVHAELFGVDSSGFDSSGVNSSGVDSSGVDSSGAKQRSADQLARCGVEVRRRPSIGTERCSRGPILAAASSVGMESRVEVSGASEGWASAAAASLASHGYVVLASAAAEGRLVPIDVCDACCSVALRRLEELLTRVDRRGVGREEEFRFFEIVHREGLRYDVPIAWMLERGADGTAHFDPGSGGGGAMVSTDADEAAAFGRLHETVDVFAQELISAILAHDSSEGVVPAHEPEPPIAGCVISQPSASSQTWHSDGDQPGLFNVFVPLVPVTPSNGPTELRPGTHHDGVARGHVEPRVAPLLDIGEVLVFDYRCRHRGLANTSPKQRPVAYVTYSIGGARDTNFPSAATLAWD